METKVRSKKSIVSRRVGKALPIFDESCSFEGYDAELLDERNRKTKGANY